MDMNKAEKSIRNACIVLGITILLYLFSIVGYLVNGAWIELIIQCFLLSIILGLTYGFLKKSRTCAIIALIYYVLNFTTKFGIFMRFSPTYKIVALLFTCLYSYLLIKGIVGTFTYKRLNKTVTNKL